ncbi:hypothetical protein C100_06770 [Sphingobium sp. C100]|nr:hypothetical protein C100_06770 [Sphingobium sp. C100]
MAGLLPFIGRARAAQPETPAPPGPAGRRALRAGEFLWLPELSPEGPILLVVSIRAQRAIVYRNGVPIGISTVSTGKEGHETPTGVFTILQKKVDHKSSLYNDAPMPFMQRLTWDGIALHAGNLPGYPASHGCIRLPMEFARALYGVTSLGMTVVIAGDQSVPRIAPSPKFLDSGPDGDAEALDATTWNPDAAPSGPVSIVVSGADARIVVLRDGVRIGTAPVRIVGDLTDMGVFTLSRVDTEGFHWLQLELPGQVGVAGHAVTADERGRLQIPSAFQDALRTILQPGATAIVTPQSLVSASSGQKLVVIDSEADE